jgi:hypothetical protein
MDVNSQREDIIDAMVKLQLVDEDDVGDVEIKESSQNGMQDAALEVEYSGAKYLVFDDYNNAEKAARAEVQALLDDMGPSAFNPDWIKHYYSISETDRNIIASEEADYRVEDMSDADVMEETGHEYDNEEDLDIESLRDELREKIAQDIEDRLEDPVQYFCKEQGMYSEEDLFKQSFMQIDEDEVCEDAVQQDGVAHFLARYDGDEQDMNIRGTTYWFYRFD